MGIYGQNGSGKTVVVDCMVLLKCLLCGKVIPPQFYYYINSNSGTAQVKYCFEVKCDMREYYAEYEIMLLKNGDECFCISGETLSVKNYIDGQRTKLTPVFEYHKGEKELFRPRKYLNYFEKNLESMVALGIAQHATENFNEEKHKPEVHLFLYSKCAQDVFAKAKGDVEKIYELSNLLQKYGMYELTVIENSHYALLALNLDTIPINIDFPKNINSRITGIMLKLTDINLVSKEIYPFVANTIRQINIVMNALVPDIQIELYNSFDKLMENGKDGVQFEIITKKMMPRYHYYMNQRK